MKRTCENCGRPLFNTDMVCWHCGHKQSLPNRHETPAELTNLEQTSSTSPVEDESEPEAAVQSSALLLYYGVITATVFLALLLTIRFLGQSPILALKSTVVSGEWVSLGSPERSYAIDIPATWDWQFQERKPTNETATEMAENDSRLLASVAPWGDLVSDIDITFVAQDDSSIVVVARSERLSRLSAQQAVDSLQGEEFEHVVVTDARLKQSESGEERAYFNLEHMDVPLRCDQYLVPASASSYVVAACSLVESFNEQQVMFEMVLDSFRTKTQ